MKYVAILAIPVALFLAGCEYKVPLTEEHTISIDSTVLGLWESVPGSGTRGQALILKFSDTEYLVHYPTGKNGAYYRAYPIKIGKVPCVQFQAIGTKDGPLDKEAKEIYHVLSYVLANDELVAKALNKDLVDDGIDDSEALRIVFLKHQNDKDLFTNPGKFQRVNTGAEKLDLKQITTNDPDLSSEIISSWGRQKEFYTKNNLIILEWTEAKELLQKKTYRGGKQYHTGWLTIYTHDGTKYLTKQPKLDIFFQFMKEHSLSIQGFGTE